MGWGPWASNNAATRAFEQLGLLPLPVGLALELMMWQAQNGAANCVIADVDWFRFKALYEARHKRALLSEIQVTAHAKEGESRANGCVDRLLRAPPGERRELLVDHLRHAVGDVLRLPFDEVAPDMGFFALGMDSLMAVDLAARLKEDLGRALPPTLSFDYPNVEALARFLIQDVLRLAEESARPMEPVSAPELATVPDDQLLALLAQELETDLYPASHEGQ